MENVCYSCRLFGCNGWKRRFKICINNIQPALKKKNEKGFTGTFDIEFSYYQLSANQKWLLYITLHIIEKYGAIGGKTSHKPQKGIIGQDYGLFEIVKDGTEWSHISNYDLVQKEITNLKLIHNNTNTNNFNFKYYWIIENNYLNRIKINNVLGLDKKGNIQIKNDDLLDFIRGSKNSSKKIFSFQSGNKIFGYVRNEDELNKIRKNLKTHLPTDDIKTGNEILNELREGIF